MEEDNQYGALPAEQGVCTELYYYNHKNNSEQLVLQLVRHEQVSSRAKREDREGDTLPLHIAAVAAAPWEHPLCSLSLPAAGRNGSQKIGSDNTTTACGNAAGPTWSHRSGRVA